jgi:hypothetical protein
MKKILKVCECKRAYINPLSGICTLCWNEIYPNEQNDVEEDYLLETREEIKFDKEMADALYRIFAGLSRSCYENTEVYDKAKPNMKKVYDTVIDWGRNNCEDLRGEKIK